MCARSNCDPNASSSRFQAGVMASVPMRVLLIHT